MISGYLITSIVLEESKLGQFSLAAFYERRARRILPALFFVMLCCLPFAWLWMLPVELYRFAQSLVGVVTFLPNIVFHHTVNYFFGSETQPLLHTWSLGVEEQFYILYPVFFILLWRLGKKWIIGTTILALIVSMGINAWWFHQSDFNASFFLAPARIWQILIGSLIALAPVTLSAKKNNFFSALGFVMISVALLFYPSATKDPGLLALVPTIGAALVIAFAGSDSWIGKLLSYPWLVAIGLGSYSLYLWHQPLFAFARIYSIVPPGKFVITIVILGTFALSYISYHFVEMPFRKKNVFARLHVVVFALMGSVFFGTLGFLGTHQAGFQSRMEPKALQILSVADITNAKCHARLTGPLIQSGTYCMLGKKDVAPTFAVIGDSHAGSLVHALEERANAESMSFLVMTEGWCVPFIGFGNRSKPSCRDLIDESLKQVVKNESIKVVILSAQWANYTKGYRHGSNPIAYYDDSENNFLVERNSEVFKRSLRRTIDYLKLHKKLVMLVGPIPEHPFDVKAALTRSLIFNRPLTSLNPVSLDEYKERNKEAIEILNEVHKEVRLVDPSRIFCSDWDGKCRYATSEGLPLYSDGNHPSALGSRLLVETFF